MRWLMSLTAIMLLNALPLAADAAGVHARFDLDDRRGAPFPSDRFTVANPIQNTGLRVNLPTPPGLSRDADRAAVSPRTAGSPGGLPCVRTIS
jgi:hypothetical protein